MENGDAYSLLASLYQTAREAVGVARRAGLPVEFVEADGPAISVWGSILAEAQKRDRLSAIESVVEGDYPGVEIGRALSMMGHAGGGRLRAFKEPVALASLDNYERITGSQPTLLPISFLATGLLKARSVARVRCGDGSFGSGFLIERNLFVTNRHVLSGPTEAEGARVEFGYELTDHGTIRPPVEFGLDPNRCLWTSEADDLTITAIKGDANQGWGAIPVSALTISSNEFVNIVQHPGGGPKQIALYHNLVIFSDGERLRYLTDTMPGSSGSPVFDSQWRLVAVHHSGGWLKTADRKSPVFCNEGVAVGLLSKAISSLRV